MLKPLIAIILMAALTACKTQYTYGPGVYYNPTPDTVRLEPEPTSNRHQEQTPDPETANTVTGCIPQRKYPEIHICYTSPALQEAAEHVANQLPLILWAVNHVIGPTGPVTIWIIPPNRPYHGVFDPEGETRTAIICNHGTGPDRDLVGVVAHELTHAAVDYATADRPVPIPHWINEAIATLVQAHVGQYLQMDVPHFANTALTTPDLEGPDYIRAQRIGMKLREFGGLPPYGKKLAEKDPVKSITGMELTDFARAFWTVYSQYAPESGITAIPPYGAVRMRQPWQGPLGLIRIEGGGAMDLDQLESIPDLSAKFSGFRYYLRDLWEPYKEGRLSMDRVANATASRIANKLLPGAEPEEKKHLIMICKLLREAVYGVRDYDRVMKKILG